MGRQDRLSIYIPWGLGVCFFFLLFLLLKKTYPLLHNTHIGWSSLVCAILVKTQARDNPFCVLWFWMWSRRVYTIFFFFFLKSHFGTIVCFITFLPFESWFLHLWFHFSLFCKKCKLTPSCICFVAFFRKMQTHPLLDFAFLFSFTQKCIFFFLHGIQLHEKSSNPTSSNCHFCMVHKK